MLIAAASPLAKVTFPGLAYNAVLPVFIILGAAMLGILAEAVVAREYRFPVQLAITGGGLLAAVCDVVALHGTRITTASNSIAIDPAGLFLQATILVMAMVSLLLVAERSDDVGGSAIVAQAAAGLDAAAKRQ